MARAFSRVRVVILGPSQSDAIEAREVVVGERGVTALTELDDLRVEVTGERGSYVIWPGNISWAIPMVPSPVVPPLPEPMESPTNLFGAAAKPVKRPPDAVETGVSERLTKKVRGKKNE